MRMGRALSDHYAGITKGQPATFAGLVEAVGGSRAAAEILGYKGPREVQRQVAYDKAQRGEAAAGQKRRFTAEQRDKLADAAEAKDWDKARDEAKRDGIKAGVDGIMHYSSKRGGEPRSIETTITDPAAIDDLFDALAEHDYRAAAEVFDDAFFGAYGLPGAYWQEVDALDIS